MSPRTDTGRMDFVVVIKFHSDAIATNEVDIKR